MKKQDHLLTILSPGWTRREGVQVIWTVRLVQWWTSEAPRGGQGLCAANDFRLLCGGVEPYINLYANGMVVIIYLRPKKVLLKDNYNHSSAKNLVEQNLSYCV